MSLAFSPLHPVFVAEGGIIGDSPQLNRFVNLPGVAPANLAAFESAATGAIENVPGPEPITTGRYGWN
jgi:hypothetical protein